MSLPGCDATEDLVCFDLSPPPTVFVCLFVFVSWPKEAATAPDIRYVSGADMYLEQKKEKRSVHQLSSESGNQYLSQYPS